MHNKIKLSTHYTLIYFQVYTQENCATNMNIIMFTPSSYKYINTGYPQEYINLDPLDNDRFVNIYMATISIKNDV